MKGKGASIAILIFVALAVLHQDSWNWDRADLVFGFMPIGLFYHACYSVVAAAFWFVVIRFAWPSRLERWAEGGDHGE
ncbi:MAG: DUF3311 domain-containing protein [Verrucomicrobiales bacterium]